ncbi:MAG TPA: hypothetical protein VKR32_20210 [Puia sp.]|nr:hypothetical protein [Puia sp.]
MKSLLLVCLLFSTSIFAQSDIENNSRDFKTINGLLRAVLKGVTNKRGEVRNWTAFRNLFLPTCTFTVVNHNDSLFKPLETFNLDEFIKAVSQDSDEVGYTEKELGRITQRFNGIANVFQGFVGVDAENNKQRGVNSYQLVLFNNRWYVANLVWTLETNGAKFPKELLGIRENK